MTTHMQQIFNPPFFDYLQERLNASEEEKKHLHKQKEQTPNSMLGHTSHSQEIDESQLIEQAKSGDAEAYGDLYTLNMQPVFRFFYARLDSRQDAEDLTEETFLRVWRSLPNFENKGVPFLAYLFLVARNLLIDYRRRFSNSNTIVGIHENFTTEPHSDASEAAMRNIQHEELRQALDKLNEDHQTVLVSRFLSELSTQEVAQVMGRSPGAVRVLQHRALKALKKHLQ